MGDIAGKCALLQELLGGLLRDSAASSAALMAGHDDCVRLQEHTALLSKQFSHAALQAVDDQRGLLTSVKTKMEAQHLALVAIGEQRDEAKAEAAVLASRMAEHAVELSLSSEERDAMEATHGALQARLGSLEAELAAAQAAALVLREENEELSAAALEAAASHQQAQAVCAALTEKCAGLAQELERGEAAVGMLQLQQQSVCSALAAERASLAAKCAALAAQMTQEHAAMGRLKEEAAAQLEAVGRQNADLVSRNAQLSLEMEALAGTSTAAMAPALAEARAALAAAQARCAELAAQNSVLADQAQAAQSGEAALMQARLALISQGFESIHTARGPPSESGLTDDTASEAGFSDLASNVSEAPGLSDATRAANRARAAQNKAKFDAIKAERNAFKAEAKKAARELDRMRLEVTKVQELKSQLKALQETLYV